MSIEFQRRLKALQCVPERFKSFQRGFRGHHRILGELHGGFREISELFQRGFRASQALRTRRFQMRSKALQCGSELFRGVLWGSSQALE